MSDVSVGKWQKREITQFKDDCGLNLISIITTERGNIYAPRILHGLNFRQKISESENEINFFFNNTDHYFNLLRQSFGDLDETRQPSYNY
jgi:hypothetical protein